ncbi:MAG: tetratricopeptide repeat protein [Myxococcota bacterium]|nr:tetratricopeptide repeat protein [Myxococcota bacterium]
MLEKLCQALRSAGQGRALVQLVETWSALGKLPDSVALLEARVLLELRLVDRAWVRLQECEAELGDSLEHAVLYGELFLKRGWPARARRHVEKALEFHPDQPDLLALLRSTDASSPSPPGDDRELERSGTPDERLELAERYLCTGSHLRARSVLERLRSTEGYWSERVEDLIWAIEGQFAQEEEDIMALAESLLPLVAALEPSQSGMDHSTQTRIGPILVDMDDPPVGFSDGAPFPALFRWIEEEKSEGEVTAEVTAVSHMTELGSESLAQISDEDEDTGTNQTRIMHVIHRDEEDGGETTAGSIALEHADLTDLEASGDLDLDVSVPMDDPSMGQEFAFEDVEFESDAPLLESEDADRVVMTRTEMDLNDEPDWEEDPQTIEVVPQKLTPNKRTPGRRKRIVQKSSVERGDGWRDEVTQELSAPKLPVETPDAVETTAPLLTPMATGEEPLGVIGRHLSLLAILAILFGGFGLLLGNRVLSVRASKAVIDDAYAAMNQADYQQLLRSEARLELELSEGRGPLGARYAAVALMKLVLWGDYSGGPRRLEAASDAVQAGMRFSDAPDALALANAMRLFYIGDLSRASNLISSRSNEHPEVVFLRSRIAFAGDRLEEARAFAEDLVVLGPGSVRNQLWLAQVCRAEADLDCAQDALKRAGALDSKHPDLDLIRIQIDSKDSTPRDQIERLSAYLRGNQNLSPRRAGSLEYEMAALYVQLGEQSNAKEALERVLARDPENSSARYLSGVLRFEENRLSAAVSDFEACLDSRPSDQLCVAGRIQVLLDQDRVEGARELVENLERTEKNKLSVDLLDAWVGWAEEREHSVLLDMLSDMDTLPEAAMLRGLVYAHSGEQEAAELEFLRAVEGMQASADPLLRRLLGRVYANLALLGSGEVYDDYASKALQFGPIDPVVRVLVGRRLDSAGFREHAAEQLDQAVNLGPETALVHYARGSFYMDYGDKHERTRTSWHRYRQLKPTGPRAKRVESRLQALQ